MIPRAAIIEWGVTRPWPNTQAIEQDLLLARMIVEIYNHPRLSNELVFRGGTCLHQVVLPAPFRYSEDLDFVRTTNTGIGPVFDALREVAAAVGLEVSGTELDHQPKLRMKAISEDNPNLSLRVKVEINTHETSPAEPVVTRQFDVSSEWFTGTAPVTTFTDAEMMSTKLRALYQRKKGRDLFDMWLGLTQMGLAGEQLWRCSARTGRMGSPPTWRSPTWRRNSTAKLPGPTSHLSSERSRPATTSTEQPS